MFTDYRTLNIQEKIRVDAEIINEMEKKHYVNKHNGFEYDEPDYTLKTVHEGNTCAKCWRIHYNCLCSHDS